jgi:hypothetical protein
MEATGGTQAEVRRNSTGSARHSRAGLFRAVLRDPILLMYVSGLVWYAAGIVAGASIVLASR